MRSLGKWVPNRMARSGTWLIFYSTGKLQQHWSLSYQAMQSEQLTNFCRLASKLIGLKLPATLLWVVGQICCDRPWASGEGQAGFLGNAPVTVKREASTPLPFMSWCMVFLEQEGGLMIAVF